MIRSIFLLLCLSAVLIGCAQVETQSADRIYWPEPPVPPRFVYEATLRSEESVRQVTATERFREVLSGPVKEKSIFAKPYDVAARSGLVVVSDTVLRQGFIFNLRRQKVYRFGHVGKQGKLIKPMGVALDAAGKIYVADVRARAIQVYDDFGMYLATIGSRDELDRPVSVAVSPDGQNIYVVDAGGIDSQRHRVVVYNAGGEMLFAIGSRGEAAGRFNLPNQMALAPDGTLYVLDAGNFRVQAFSPDGTFLRTWGQVGNAFGNLARPRGITVDPEGNVYVSDAAFRNFQVFDPEGRLLLAIGSEALEDKPGQYALPAGMACDENGNIYIVDQLYAKVEVIRRLTKTEMSQALVGSR